MKITIASPASSKRCPRSSMFASTSVRYRRARLAMPGVATFCISTSYSLPAASRTSRSTMPARESGPASSSPWRSTNSIFSTCMPSSSSMRPWHRFGSWNTVPNIRSSVIPSLSKSISPRIVHQPPSSQSQTVRPHDTRGHLQIFHFYMAGLLYCRGLYPRNPCPAIRWRKLVPTPLDPAGTRLRPESRADGQCAGQALSTAQTQAPWPPRQGALRAGRAPARTRQARAQG